MVFDPPIYWKRYWNPAERLSRDLFGGTADEGGELYRRDLFRTGEDVRELPLGSVGSNSDEPCNCRPRAFGGYLRR